MKRKGSLYAAVCSLDNLELADQRARIGKSKQKGVLIHDQNRAANLLSLQEQLANKTYKTSRYDVFIIRDPKEREIYRLPYFPDRIAHHAIMNVLKPILLPVFTADSYSCIEGKGTHSASRALQTALKDKAGTVYGLKLDIRKFYPSIDHAILKQLLRRKVKDADLLWLIDEIIDSAPGLPIGNYLSQYLANFYLTYFDHWLKEEKKVKYYFRYADDIVVLGPDKPYLHQVLGEIRLYLETELKLEIKGNYQVFPVVARSLDFVGYRHYHTHKLLRKRIKQRWARNRNPKAEPSYKGLAKHCDAIHLTKKLNHEQIQRAEHKSRNNSFQGREDKNCQSTQQRDHRS